jgi:hypothetical protein
MPMSTEPTHRFLEILPADVKDGGRLPLLYGALTSITPGEAGPYVPTAACDHHRAAGYCCVPFHKPISRCFGADR